jgi:hypothetical protein
MTLIAFAATLELGRAAAWGRIGASGAVASVALAAALQAVDGVALKATVDHWAAAEGAARPLTFEVALVQECRLGTRPLADAEPDSSQGAGL